MLAYRKPDSIVKVASEKDRQIAKDACIYRNRFSFLKTKYIELVCGQMV